MIRRAAIAATLVGGVVAGAGCPPPDATGYLEGRTFLGVGLQAAVHVEANDRGLQGDQRRVKLCRWDDPTADDYGVTYGTYDPDLGTFTLDDRTVLLLEATFGELVITGPKGTQVPYEEALSWKDAILDAPVGVCGGVCPLTSLGDGFETTTGNAVFSAASCAAWCARSGPPYTDCMHVPPGATVLPGLCACAPEERPFVF